MELLVKLVGLDMLDTVGAGVVIHNSFFFFLKSWSLFVILQKTKNRVVKKWNY